MAKLRETCDAWTPERCGGKDEVGTYLFALEGREELVVSPLSLDLGSMRKFHSRTADQKLAVSRNEINIIEQT